MPILIQVSEHEVSQNSPEQLRALCLARIEQASASGTSPVAITTETLADLRRKTEKAAPHFDHERGEFKPLGEVLLSCHQYVAAANPAVVLAMLDKIAALEARRPGDVSAVDAERRATYAESQLKLVHDDLSTLAEEIAYLKQVRQARDTECAALLDRVKELEAKMPRGPISMELTRERVAALGADDIKDVDGGWGGA